MKKFISNSRYLDLLCIILVLVINFYLILLTSLEANVEDSWNTLNEKYANHKAIQVLSLLYAIIILTYFCFQFYIKVSFLLFSHKKKRISSLKLGKYIRRVIFIKELAIFLMSILALFSLVYPYFFIFQILFLLVQSKTLMEIIKSVIKMINYIVIWFALLLLVIFFFSMIAFTSNFRFKDLYGDNYKNYFFVFAVMANDGIRNEGNFGSTLKELNLSQRFSNLGDGDYFDIFTFQIASHIVYKFCLAPILLAIFIESRRYLQKISRNLKCIVCNANVKDFNYKFRL